jgi:hypothetical protein
MLSGTGSLSGCCEALEGAATARHRQSPGVAFACEEIVRDNASAARLTEMADDAPGSGTPEDNP